MGDIVLTGGVNGIGKAVTELLRAQGQTVCVIDVEGGDIVADLGTKEGRAYAVAAVKERFPDGIDGLCCVAGIFAPPSENGRVLSVNYFGTIEICDGLFGLLKMRHGNCVVTTSGSLLWEDRDLYTDLTDAVLSCGEEDRLVRLFDTLSYSDGHVPYGVSKNALAIWMRRCSTEWALQGVRLNAVGPGCITTRLTTNVPPGATVNESFRFTIPMRYHETSAIPPENIAGVYAFLLGEGSVGMTGETLWADCGQTTYWFTERVGG